MLAYILESTKYGIWKVEPKSLANGSGVEGEAGVGKEPKMIPRCLAWANEWMIVLLTQEGKVWEGGGDKVFFVGVYFGAVLCLSLPLDSQESGRQAWPT